MTPWSPLAIVSVEVPSSSVISTVVFPAPSVPTVPIVTEFPVLDFAIVYVPTEGLFAELSSYRDPKTKELLLHELRTKYIV